MSEEEYICFENDLSAYLSAGNVIERCIAIYRHIQYSDWKAARKEGAYGILREWWWILTCQNVVAVRASRIYHSGLEIEKLLDRHGVKLWDREIVGRGLEVQFHVKRRQAKWMYYILKRYGVNPRGIPYDVKVEEQAGGYGPKSEPPNRRQQKAGAIVREKATRLREEREARERGGR